jgi:hypothetical protein
MLNCYLYYIALTQIWFYQREDNLLLQEYYFLKHEPINFLYLAIIFVVLHFLKKQS